MNEIKWEYKVVQKIANDNDYQKDMQSILNNVNGQGENRWELVSVIQLPSDSGLSLQFWFKRPVSEIGFLRLE